MPSRSVSVQAVIFDCDGVLVDSEPPANRVLSEILAEHGVVMSHAECRAAFLGLNPRGVADRLMELKGVNVTAPLIEQGSKRFVELLAKEGLPALPGVVEMLDDLAERRMLVAVASNSQIEELLFKLKLSGLHARFSRHAYSADALGKPKPDPGVYLHAAEMLGVEPAACVVVEDSPTGVFAGVRAGMRVLGFLGTHEDPQHAQTLRGAGAATLFSHMRELPSLLTRYAG
ncbi:MAG: HAD family phosphatase [Pyrinomonadaceae bacterium]|nr:HAD family phosphatase [Phycisphaerales bacterium]